VFPGDLCCRLAVELVTECNIQSDHGPLWQYIKTSNRIVFYRRVGTVSISYFLSRDTGQQIDSWKSPGRV
jgi:hypothetical protein